ncbi:CBK_G0011290.mRNA.1.CDS.1 [Saccharomyces cerevisiae]|nr:CBK_G0011290.mRNA.1.CDS.1 [Saccharomyces cerevisiae]CAI7213941.1 CBK_G0011290.mRNA.1.CDS.1 [Saccharomyces cerevisiae]
MINRLYSIWNESRSTSWTVAIDNNSNNNKVSENQPDFVDFLNLPLPFEKNLNLYKSDSVSATDTVIFLNDEPKAIQKKIRKALTNSPISPHKLIY